ncbi:glutathione S-transferase family protein [Gemmobacter sp.]|uniref:glutathione S-transferase family protein n=1 Tax=Gemmobacter sp. TaxID=1898957 RepID=UPI002AFE2F62|nr:glutathione S-transferase family protein [Gemmobacter sp.]
MRNGETAGKRWQLHWSSRSPFARKVMIGAHELGLAGAITCVPVKANPWLPDPVVMAVNPLGKVPVLLLADGGWLYDSSVILQFLESEAGRTDLFGGTRSGRLAIEARQAFADDLIGKLLALLDEGFRPDGGAEAETRKTVLRRVILAVLDHLDTTLPELPGSPPDAGDIATFCALEYADFRFPDLAWKDRRPRLASWHRTFRARPSARATMFGE